MHDADKTSSPAFEDVPELGLDDVLSFVRRQGAWIIGIALLAALATGVVVALEPRQYEASATLVIFPTQVSSELKPATLSVLGFQKLLESDAVVHDTKQRLVTEENAGRAVRLAVPGQLSSRIFVSRRVEDKELAPMIQAFGRGPSPEAAAAYANTWATVFLERLRNLVSGSTAATVEFVDRQYDQQRTALSTSEDRLVSARIARREPYDSLATEWLHKLAAREAQNAEARAAYLSETSRLVETYRGERAFETRQSQLEAMRQALVELQVEEAAIDARLTKAVLTLEALRAQEKTTPKSLLLRKAITDDALWNELSRSETEPDWQKLESRSLASEWLNPVYTDLMERLGVAEANEAVLRPRGAQLKTQMAALREKMAAAEASLRADQAGLVALEQARNAGYERLRVELEAGLEAEKLRRDRTLAEHTEESQKLFAQLSREVDQRKSLFQEMTTSFNEAVIAKAQQDLEEVRLAAPAVPPESPQPRRLMLKAALAGLCGAVLGLLIGIVRDRRPGVAY